MQRDTAFVRTHRVDNLQVHRPLESAVAALLCRRSPKISWSLVFHDTDRVTLRCNPRLIRHRNPFMIPQTILQSATLFAALVTLIVTPARAADTDKPQYYEVRIYTTKSAEQQQRINDYWQGAAVPAYNRLGIQPVGVFTELADSATNKIYVLIPCDSLDVFAAIPAKLADDADYQKAAGKFLNAPKTNAAYERIESSLLVAFDGMKYLTVPPADQRPNVFELRNYLSPSEGKGLNKIHMFESGEITVMKEVGLAPIFYGRTVVGSPMPSLFYMTCGENMDAHKQHWAGFSAAPVWKQLQADPQFKDNMTGMIKVILKRTPASQI